MPFLYENNRFQLKSQKKYWDVSELAESIGSPFYLYDLDEIEKRLKAYKDHFGGSVHYAMKANSHPLILKK